MIFRVMKEVEAKPSTKSGVSSTLVARDKDFNGETERLRKHKGGLSCRNAPERFEGEFIPRKYGRKIKEERGNEFLQEIGDEIGVISGSNSTCIWFLDVEYKNCAYIAKSLDFIIDHDPHGEISPSNDMDRSEFDSATIATRDDWKEINKLFGVSLG